jgi:protein TonB
MSTNRPVRAPTFRMESRREKRPVGWLALSAVLHVLVIGALIWDFSNPDAFTDVDMRTPGGPGPAGGGGGGGAPRVTYIDIAYYRPARQREETPPPVEEIVIPTPMIAPVEMPVDTVRFEAPRSDTAPITGSVLGDGPGSGGGVGAGTGSGGGIGSGRGTGVGSGVGPGTGGGGGEIFPPAPRYSILPPLPRPKSVTGRDFQLKFTISPDGRVLDVQIRPEIRDADYRRRFLSQLYEWTFAPAMTREGLAVKGETIVTVRL